MPDKNKTADILIIGGNRGLINARYADKIE